MEKVESPACLYGDSPHDEAVHTFFDCCRLTREGIALVTKFGKFTPESVGEIMLRGKKE